MGTRATDLGGRRCRAWPLVLALLLAPAPAAAYIDPLSGSVILQVLAASALGALFVVKRFWGRVLVVLSRFWTRLTGR